MPGLAEHHCAAGKPGGLVTKLNEGTFFGYVLEHVALELSHLGAERGAPRLAMAQALAYAPV